VTPAESWRGHGDDGATGRRICGVRVVADENDTTWMAQSTRLRASSRKDIGVHYRNVDCRYVYNLDISSLSGQGNYMVWVNIDGANIATPAAFDLR
jgi:hypothetical protein